MGVSIINKEDTLLAYSKAFFKKLKTDSNSRKEVYIGVGSEISNNIIIKSPVFIGANNIINAEGGCPIFIGPGTNIHDNCKVTLDKNSGIRSGNSLWSLYIEGKVSILYGTTISGYCKIGRNSFIGQSVDISNAEIRQDCVIMHRAKIFGNIVIPAGRFVMPGMKVIDQKTADNLPRVPREYISLNPYTVRGYMDLMMEYLNI